MKETKRDTLIYEGLGFPIKLVDVPFKKRLGEWILDIDFNKLQKIALHALAHKPSPLTGAELSFIRKFLEMTTTSFGKLFGVTHAAVLKWESDQSKIDPTRELCIRLYIVNYLHANDSEFRKLYNDMISNLSKRRNLEEPQPIEINEEELIAC